MTDAFIKYGPKDFTPGHSLVCSFQIGDPKDCPVCGNWLTEEEEADLVDQINGSYYLQPNEE